MEWNCGDGGGGNSENVRNGVVPEGKTIAL